jgi:hypothetical protein
MPQEFTALRCFACRVFQVQIAKKANKFNCNMCGEKQSVTKVYGRSYAAKDLRLLIQGYNASEGRAAEEAASAAAATAPEYGDDYCNGEGAGYYDAAEGGGYLSHGYQGGDDGQYNGGGSGQYGNQYHGTGEWQEQEQGGGGGGGGGGQWDSFVEEEDEQTHENVRDQSWSATGNRAGSSAGDDFFGAPARSCPLLPAHNDEVVFAPQERKRKGGAVAGRAGVSGKRGRVSNDGLDNEIFNNGGLDNEIRRGGGGRAGGGGGSEGRRGSGGRGSGGRDGRGGNGGSGGALVDHSYVGKPPSSASVGPHSSSLGGASRQRNFGQPTPTEQWPPGSSMPCSKDALVEDDEVEESRPLVDPLQGGDSTFAASDTAADDFFGSATVVAGGENG